MVDIREYIDANGQSAFGKWFERLNLQAATKVTTALEKIAKGNFSNVESIGAGVSEYKIDWGPGYRFYFGMDGEMLVILVGGGTKKRQSSDIAAAKKSWAEFTQRKKLAERLRWH